MNGCQYVIGKVLMKTQSVTKVDTRSMTKVDHLLHSNFLNLKLDLVCVHANLLLTNFTYSCIYYILLIVTPFGLGRMLRLV